jgi:hypothetical protein
MLKGLMGLIGTGGSAPRIPGGDVGDVKHGRTYARYDGSQAPKTGYFARGGMADPEEEEEGEVSPELKLAAYELLECLDSSRYAGSDGKVGRAEAFARAMLAFVRLADEMPHVEGAHEEEDEGGEE